MALCTSQRTAESLLRVHSPRLATACPESPQLRKREGEAAAARGYNWTGAFRQSRPAAAHLDAGSSIIDGEAAVSRADGLSRFL